MTNNYWEKVCVPGQFILLVTHWDRVKSGSYPILRLAVGFLRTYGKILWRHS
jgi:hypothetical protein